MMGRVVCGTLVVTLGTTAPVIAGEFSLRTIPDVTPEEVAAAPDAFARAESGGAEDLSAGRAILYSLVLPGWGDYYAGRKGRAVVFFATEAAIWTSYATFRKQGGEREDSFQDYAVRFAHVERTGHSEDFYAELRNYDSSDDYEAEIKKDARFELFPDIGYESLDRYYRENRVADFEAWQWDSFDRRIEYSELRSASKSAYRRADYMIAVAAANRLVSAIFAYTAVRSTNSSTDEQASRFRIDVDTPLGYGSPYDAIVTLSRSF